MEGGETDPAEMSEVKATLDGSMVQRRTAPKMPKTVTALEERGRVSQTQRKARVRGKRRGRLLGSTVGCDLADPMRAREDAVARNSEDEARRRDDRDGRLRTEEPREEASVRIMAGDGKKRQERRRDRVGRTRTDIHHEADHGEDSHEDGTTFAEGEGIDLEVEGGRKARLVSAESRRDERESEGRG